MATKCLYWDRPYETAFDGRLVRFVGKDGRAGVVVDQTLFYPEGGGQPCDKGHISLLDSGLSVLLGTGDLTVSGVSLEAGEVVHWIDLDGCSAVAGALPSAPVGGWPVQGRVDWSRRFDFMQQHTGQHILTRAFEDEVGARTVGFHLTEEYVSIDLDVVSVTAEEIAKAEDRANKVVFSNIPVIVKEYSRGQLPPEVRARFEIDADTIRVICVGDFDACPCGGTHLAASGQVGLIKVNQTDRAHGGVRVVFRCGGRALADYREKQEILDQTARVLSQPVHAVPAAAKAMNEKLLELQVEHDRVQETLLELEIEALTRPDVLAGQECVVVELAGKSPDRLKYAGKKIAEASGKVTVCFAGQPRFSAIVVSLAPGGPDARAVVSEIAAAWGGRGGGTPQIAQLGSKEPLSAAPETVAEDLKRICGRIFNKTES